MNHFFKHKLIKCIFSAIVVVPAILCAEQEVKIIKYQYAALPAIEEDTKSTDLNELFTFDEINTIVFIRKYHRINSELFFEAMLQAIRNSDTKIFNVSTKDTGDELTEVARGLIHYNTNLPVQFILKCNPAKKDEFFLILTGSGAFEDRRFRVNPS